MPENQQGQPQDGLGQAGAFARPVDVTIVHARVGQRPGRAQWGQGGRPDQDLPGRLQVLLVVQCRHQGRAVPVHEVDHRPAHTLHVHVVDRDTRMGQLPDDLPDFVFRINDQRAAHQAVLRGHDGADHRQDSGEGLARAGLAQRQRVPAQGRAGHPALRVEQGRPLGDPDLVGPGRYRRLGARIGDGVDQPQFQRQACRDGPIHLEQLPVQPLQRPLVPGAQAVAHVLAQPLQQRLAGRAGASGLCLDGAAADQQVLDDRPVSVGKITGIQRRSGALAAARPSNQTGEITVVKVVHGAQDLPGRLGGHGPHVCCPGLVKEQGGPARGDARVAQRDQVGRGAADRHQRTGREAHPAGAQSLHDLYAVVQRHGLSAWGVDFQLNMLIKILVMQLLHGRDQRQHHVLLDGAGDRYNGVV